MRRGGRARGRARPEVGDGRRAAADPGGRRAGGGRGRGALSGRRTLVAPPRRPLRPARAEARVPLPDPADRAERRGRRRPRRLFDAPPALARRDASRPPRAPDDEERPFFFHAPHSESAADELKTRARRRGRAARPAVPAPAGDADVLLAGGSAAVFFHEVLGHPLEADAETSPLRHLPEARVSVSDLEVLDDPRRLDLFGGYEHDDEGVAPRAVRLVASGRLAGRLTDRAHAAAPGSTGHGRRSGPTDAPRPRGANVIVSPGSADADEMLRRLGNGLWIDAFSGGSVELASGSFRLRFPRARRVRRGRLADELGGGVLAGEMLPVLAGIEPAMGRDARPCRSFGWCSRGGEVVPVGGEAPDVLLRGLTVRPEA